MFPVNHAPMQNLDFLQSLGPKLSGRETARAEDNVLLPFSLLSGARRRVLISCTGLPFEFSFSAAGKNKSVKLCSEEPENSPLHSDFLQVGICHDRWSWLVHRKERGGEGRNERQQVAELPRGNRIPRYHPSCLESERHAKRDAELTCDSILLVHRLHPAVGNQARGQSPNGIFWCSLTTSERDIHFAFVPFTLTP